MEGRVLPAPPVQYKAREFRPDFGSWNLKEDRKFRTGAGITAWTYREIQLPNQHPLNSQVKGFVEKLERSYQSTISAHRKAPAPLTLNCTCPAKQFADLEKFLIQCREKNLNTLLLVLPSHSHTLFASIKYLADVKYGINTICLEASTLQKHIEKSWYAATIAQKLNTQGGGINQCLPDSELKGLVSKSTMIVGIDVTNPFPKGKPDAVTTSIIGVVASNKPDCTQWPASVRRQENPEKMTLDLKEVLIERFQCWKKANKRTLPSQIIIYSNGVTADNPLIAKETKAIEDAIADLYSRKSLPKTTIMLVSKSHHTRFYPANEEAADGQSGNPKVGTVVDQVITSQVPWDFYLQSHPGTPKNGTVRPAHYVVVKDDIELGADGVQKLVSFVTPMHLLILLPSLYSQCWHSLSVADCSWQTNSLCYMSGRGTRALSTVSPAHYANLVCERARCYIQASSIASEGNKSGSGDVGSNGPSSQWTRGVHPELQDSMWYI